ncbi:MAG TPA: ABC transporter substrate-binding protein [Hyphomicrobiales bacterium]|nr:ABC transporter substrate-binding protein [Hyphomicrobiales bacterium]
MLRRSFLAFTAAATLAFAAFPGVASAQGADVTLKAATNAEPDVLDIQLAGDPPADFITLQNVFEQPWGWTYDGKLKETVAKIDVSPDRKTITFHVHPGVKFSSGDELTGADIKFSWDRYKAKSRWAGRHAQFIDHVDAPDKYTAVFHFSRPDVGFFGGGGVYVESKAYFDRVGEKEASTHPIGFGPYSIGDYKPGQYLDLKRFDGYYGGKPEVKSARIFFVADDNTRIAKLKAGEVDIITSPPYPEIAGLKKDGYNIAELPAHPTINVQFHTWNPTVPWYKQKVRLAIAHAIDADAIVKNLLAGVPTRYAFLAPGEFGYDPTLKPYSYDPALAKKLLAEAGYPNGFTMPLYYTSVAYYGIKQTVEAVVLYLQQVGIKADVHAMDQMQILKMLFSIGGDKTGNYVGVTAMPAANVGLATMDTITLAYWGGGPGRIKPAWHNEAFDQVVTQAINTVDDEKRSDLIKQAVRILHDDVGVVPLWNSVYVYASDKSLHYKVVEHRLPALRLADITMTK